MFAKYFLSFLFFVIMPVLSMADDVQFGKNFHTTDEILALAHAEKPTNCASKIFLESLIADAHNIDDEASENIVQAWAQNTITDADVLERVLKCPEVQSVSDSTKISFTPFTYTFPNKRTITINYESTPKIMKHHILLARKRSLPDGNPNPDLFDNDSPAIYINTDPAWYAIMVVQSGTLSEFVGPGKNNTVSMKWINDNIDTIYPHGYYCTSRSAWANDSDTINHVVHNVVDLEHDTNDYYVAGDINLEWVMYAEIAADIIITVATMGTGEAAMMSIRGARAVRASKNLVQTMAKMRKIEAVGKYAEKSAKIAQHADDIAKLEKNIKNGKKYKKALDNLERAKKSGKNVAKYQKEVDDIMDAARKIDPKITGDLLKDTDKLTDTQKELKEGLKTLEKEADEMADASKDVRKYREQEGALKDLVEYTKDLNAWRRPQTGNVITRPLKKMYSFGKSLHAANNGEKVISTAAKLGRKGMSSFSAKAGDWLFQASRKNLGRLARFYRDAGFVYGAISFLGDMYDKTSTTSQEYSNGIEFKPFCLLSADDLNGQDNVVNYGMWLMWLGNSTDPADDDAAFLQSMDFAEKFYYELDTFQDEHGSNCNVDIYVVRPIIRLDETNPNKPTGELFYLFMNDTPWTTNEQFNEQIGDIESWERAQSELNTTDPKNKYKRNTDETTDTNTASETDTEIPTTTPEKDLGE